MFKEIFEGIIKTSDVNIDKIISTWDGSRTFEYNLQGAVAFGKLFKDVLITSDKKFMHIPDSKPKEVQSIINKLNLVEL